LTLSFISPNFIEFYILNYKLKDDKIVCGTVLSALIINAVTADSKYLFLI